MLLAAALASTLLATGAVPAGADAPVVTRLAAISPGNNGSSPGTAVAVGGGGGYFFVANDGANGAELHHGDGSGTSTLVKDINPGFADANPDNLTAVGSTLLFVADDGTHGRQLWRSDGTAAGTTMVRDFGADANLGSLKASGGRLYFTLGTDLYVSDGTAGGTRRLTSTLGEVINLAPFAGGIAFSGDGAPRVSDGTVGGTHVVTAALSAPDSFTELDGRLYFAATGASGRHELYRSDGTAGGTAIVKDIASGGGSSNPTNLTVVGHELFFTADDSGTGANAELWKSDGTNGGTVIVKDINSGGGSSPSWLTAFGGNLYFNADDGNGGALWRSDGTSGGTVPVHDADGDAVVPATFLTVSGSALFFGAREDADGYELWRTDGTPSGTAMVKDIMSGRGDGFGEVLAAVGGGRVMLTADDGVHGREPWISDGTGAGTTLDDVDLQGLANATPSVRLGDQQFYVALSSAGELQLNVTDGTPGGTRPIVGPTGVSGMTVFGGRVWFVGFDAGQGGDQLWTTDGTAAGTHVVSVPGLLVHGGAGPIAAAGRSLYFVGEVAATGTELWKTDGTAAGTTIVKDINPRAGLPSNPASLMAMGSRLMFSADDGVHGTELWVSDGTAAGTTMVQDSVAGRVGVSPTGMVAVGCEVYYAADVPVSPGGDQELWVSDGTAAGTGLVKDINSGGASAPSGFVVAGGKVYFSANGDGTGMQVWTTDGTAAGTRVVDGSIHDVMGLTALGSHLLFSSGTRLYGYDTTGASGAPAQLAGSLPFAPPTGPPIGVDGDVAYFANTDAAHGMELWSTDGTAAGTALAEDLNAGPASSFPAPLGVGTGAPVLTTDDPSDGTVLVRLGDTHASAPASDAAGPTCTPPPPDPAPPTDTTTTTTDTQPPASTPPPTQPAPPAQTTQPPLRATAPADRRVKPRALSLKITRRTAARLTVTGTLKLPTGTARKSCTGTITLTVRQSTRTLGHATAHLTKTCTFKATITTKKRTGHTTPKLTARFTGNPTLQPATSASRAVS